MLSAARRPGTALAAAGTAPEVVGGAPLPSESVADADPVAVEAEALVAVVVDVPDALLDTHVSTEALWWL